MKGSEAVLFIAGGLVLLPRSAPAQGCPELTFRPAITLAAGTGPSAVAVSDFNEDGHRDLAAANRGTDNVSILLGDGAGGFANATSFGVGDQPGAVASADFNRDGHTDLVVGNYFGSSVSILLGTGAGGFGPATNFFTGGNPDGLAVRDFNEDGVVDLAVADTGSILVLLGTGTGAFAPATSVPAGSTPSHVVAGDLNRDGHADLVAVNQSGADVSVLLGAGNGTFSAGGTFAVGTEPVVGALHDFNRDGALDLVIGNWLFAPTPALLLGNGTGGFGPRTGFLTPTSAAAALAVGDLDRDGRADLAVANAFEDTVTLLLGTGTGSFGVVKTWPVGPNPLSIAIADFNEDGRLDLVTANADYYPGNLTVLLNDCTRGVRDGTFERGQPWPDWTIQTSTQFGTPLCNPGLCGTGGGTAPPYAGGNWAWFGGTPYTPETATLGQTLVLPASGALRLRFQMRSGFVSAPATDTLVVSVDGVSVAVFPEPMAPEASYAPREVDLTPFADGAAHDLLFTYQHPDSGPANFTVDNMELEDRDRIFGDGFEAGP